MAPAHALRSGPLLQALSSGRPLLDEELDDLAPPLPLKDFPQLELKAKAAASSLDSPDVEIAISAARTLGQLGLCAAGFADVLAQKLTHPHLDLRRIALWSLAELGVDAASPHTAAIAHCLGDEDYAFRTCATMLLQRLGASAASELASLVADEPGQLGNSAASTLRGMDGAASDALIQELSKRRHTVEGLLRLLHALYTVGADTSPHGKVVEEFLLHDNAAIRCAAARVCGLGKALLPSVIDALAQLLGDLQATVRAASAEALGCIGAAASKHVDQVSSLLGDKQANVRDAAVAALGQIALSCRAAGDDASAFQLSDSSRCLLAQMLVQQQDKVSLRASIALSAMGDAGEIVLVSQLNHADRAVRLCCIEALQKTSETKFGVALASQLQDANPQVRAMMVGALGRLGPPAVVHAPVLVDIMHNDSDECVRTSTMRALAMMASGREHGTHNVLLQDPTILAASISATKEARQAKEEAAAMKVQVDAFRQILSAAPREGLTSRAISGMRHVFSRLSRSGQH